MPLTINGFRDKYFFLSNFYSVRVEYQGYTFLNNEAAFQAAKCPERMAEFTKLTPSEAKRLGRHVQLRPDWEEIKGQVMYDVCKAKFTQNAYLGNLLLATQDSILVEDNTWGDRIWGVCRGVGENRLGKILMKIREELKAETGGR